jgi:nucleoside-diphosphate-sugar epimerase
VQKLIIGCGYLGQRVAQQWLQAGDQVTVLTRSTQRASELSKAGLQALVGDLTRPDSLPSFPACETVLYAVGYDRSSSQSIEEVYVQGLENFLARTADPGGKVIYISSTGVYGQNDGSWVNEDSPCHPTRPGGVACLAAESLLASHPLGAGSIVLRLAGLYGPDRIPRRAAIEAGKPVAAAENGYLNLIHVVDAVEVILAAEACHNLPPVMLVSDGQPVLRGTYFQEIARLLGAPKPQFSPPDEASHQAGRATSDKRISNQRLLETLQISFQYPSFREGLAALLQNPEDPDMGEFG